MMNLPRRSTLFASSALLAVLLATPNHAHAQGGCLSGGSGGCPDSGTPEIDPSLATSAFALLGGTILLVRSRRRQ